MEQENTLHQNTKAAEQSITELVFILDRSGSMAGLEADTIGGFNAMLEKQKQQDGLCWVTTVLFSNESQTIHDRVRLEDVKPMTRDDYVVGGCTALIDAIGDAIQHISGIHKYARPEDVPAHTVFVITTDGMENASRKYSAREVRQMIERRKEEQGWEFLFIGANIDAVETAAHYGIHEDRAVTFLNDSEGQALNYAEVGEAMCQLRASVPLDEGWKKDIVEDYKRRSGR